MSQKIKLFILIEALSQSQKKDLEKWLKCSLFYRNKSILLVYKFICSQTLPLDYDRLQSFLIKKYDWSTSFIRNLMHELTQAILDFLSYEALQKRPILSKVLVYNDLHSKIDGTKLSKSLLESIDHTITEDPLEKYQKNQYLEYYYHPEGTKKNNLKQSLEDLDVFYFVEYFKHQIFHFFYNENNQPYVNPNGDLTLSLFNSKKEQLIKHPKLELYYSFYSFITQLNEESYTALKQILSNYEQFHKLDFLEHLQLYKALRNILYTIINQVQTNTPFFNQEAFLLLKQSIDKGFLNDGGYLGARSYYNLMITGLKLGYYDLILSLIKRYGEHLNPEIQQRYLDCVWGYYYFYVKNYKKSAYHFMLIGLNDDPIMLYSQIRLFQILYLRQEFELLKGRMQSFEEKLKKLNITLQVKEHIQLQTKAIHKLLEVQEEPYKLNESKDWIQEQKKLMYKDWYLEQIQFIKI